MKNFILFIFFLVSLNAKGLEFKTLSADFKQTINGKNSIIIYRGNLLAHNKYGAFWNYKTPIEKKIYFNVDKISIIEPSLEQAIITNIKDAPDLNEILKNAKQIENNIFSCKIDDINYKIKIKNDLPIEITYTDKLDNEVQIIFENVIKNKNIDKNLLNPQIPSNYDVLIQ